MDEITMFAELRPNDTLTDADLAHLRSELFPDLAPIATLGAGPRDRSDAAALGGASTDGSHPRRNRTVAVAAAFVALAGLGGIWLVADHGDSPEPPVPAADPVPLAKPSTQTVPSNTTATTMATVEPGAAPATRESSGMYDVPHVGFAEPGWTVTRAFDDTAPANRLVVLLTDAGFEGPLVEITVDEPGTELTAPSGDSTVELDGVTGHVTTYDVYVGVQWIDVDGRFVRASGWQTELDDVVALAKAATVTDTDAGTGTQIEVGALPDGATIADSEATAALGRHAQYQFTHADGRWVEARFAPGGTRGRYQLQALESNWQGEGRRLVMVGDRQAVLVDQDEIQADRPPDIGTETAHDVPYPGGVYELTVPHGYWTWQFATERFESEQQLIDLVAGATVVDADTWHASLADDIVGPDDRARAVEQALADVPLPPGFEPDSLVDGGVNDRYQFVAEVSGAIACGWFDEWLAAEAGGDIARRDAAAAALATSRDWAMFDTITEEGRWAQTVWGLADQVNADPTDTTPKSTPEGVEGTLGCERFTDS